MKKLEIGPGKHKIGHDWDTIDMRDGPQVDIVWDIRKLPIPIVDKSYDIVYMSHILEHVPWFQTVDLLVDILRILKPSGLLEIWVPDFEKIINAYRNHELVSRDRWYKHNPEKDPMKWINGRIFTYGPGESNWHRAVFDFEYLERCLQRAGFISIERLTSKPRAYNHGWINLGVVAIKPGC